MTLTEAFSKIHSPKGVTTVIAGLMSGDSGPLQSPTAVGETLESARRKLADTEHAQRTCGSDWAYWGYEGDRAYWSAVVSILEAAQFVGPDHLPDVDAPDTEGVVMDICDNVQAFGEEILRRARIQASNVASSFNQPLNPS